MFLLVYIIIISLSTFKTSYSRLTEEGVSVFVPWVQINDPVKLYFPKIFIHSYVYSRNRPCKHDGPCDSRSECPCFENKAHCRSTCRCTKTCAYYIYLYSGYFFILSPSLFKPRPTKMERMHMCFNRKSMWDKEMLMLQSECRMWSRCLSFVWYKVCYHSVSICSISFFRLIKSHF